MKKLAMVQLDVFTERALTGNALAVCLDGRGLSTEQMQALARETNLSETTFILPGEAAAEKERGVRVRIFTVQEELPFAGHPTLGSAHAWTHLGSPYEAAMALADMPDEEALREALSIVIGLGARAAAQVIRHRLRMLGARSIPAGPQAATRKRPFGLTRREHEVLDLICAEQTNAEIAAKLFLSVKTVDHHVSAILGKLGVPTRAAARRVAQSA